MLITIITLLFCVAEDFVPEASAFFAGVETDAAVLALSILVLIAFRVWSVKRLDSR